jgi:hypothetical protein
MKNTGAAHLDLLGLIRFSFTFFFTKAFLSRVDWRVDRVANKMQLP